MKKKTDRILWVDIFKGILIVLMVLAHTKNPMTHYIYAFHMAAFFFISGYTTNYEKYTLFEYIKRKFKLLVIPFFFVNTLFWGGLMVLQKTSLYSLFIPNAVSFTTLRELYLSFWTVPLAGATWFLIVLFLSSVGSKLLDEAVGETYSNNTKEYAKVLISLGLTMLTYIVLFSKNISLPFYLDMVPMAMLFICLGKLISVVYKDINKIYKYIITITLLAVYFWYTIFEYFHIEWVNKHFPDLFIMLFVTFGGIIIVYFISKLIEKINNKTLINIFDYLGKNTIAILLYHFFAFKIVFIFLYLFRLVPLKQLSQDCLIKTTTILSTVTTIFAIIISILIYKLVGLITKFIKNIDYRKLITKKSLVFLGLFILTFVYNRWTFKSDFVFDDWNNLVTLPYTKFSSLMQILPTDVYCSRPVGWIVVKIILLIFGLNYKGHAFAMMFIHFINGVLLYLVSNKMLEKNKNKSLISLVAALIFLLYPISIFASIWEAGMFDLFGCTLTLLCILIYLYVRNMNKSFKKYFLITLLIIFYYASLRTKEMFILLPVVLVVYEFFDKLSIKDSLKDTIKGIKIGQLIKNNIYLIVMCFVMVGYFGLSRYLNASSTITSDVNDAYYYTFNPIILIGNLFKYIYVYFSKDSLVYGDVISIIKYSNYHKIIVLVGCIAALVYSIAKLVKKDKIPVILMLGFVLMILPVLPMKNMHHVLYLYCPSVFIALFIAYVATDIFKIFKNFEIKLILVVLAILTLINISPSVNTFRGWWIDTAKTDSDTYDYFVKLKKKYPKKNKIYVINVPVEEGYTSFYNGDGYIVKVAYKNPKIKVYINKENYNINDEKTIVIDFNDYDFIIMK